MLRLFFIGLTMGTADLIPGISGGTIAFISGIYDRLLHELKSLSWKNFSWSFFVPLGLGMVIAILSFAHLLTYLLTVAQIPLYAFFFGIVFSSSLFCIKEERVRGMLPWAVFAAGAIGCYWVTGAIDHCATLDGTIGLITAGCCASIAMLLPGISGCYVFHLLGVYPLIIGSLTHPLASLSILVPVAIGIGMGLLIGSRCISYLLAHYRAVVAPFFIGCMMGGLNSLLPTESLQLLSWFGMVALGSVTFVMIRLALRKAAV